MAMTKRVGITIAIFFCFPFATLASNLPSGSSDAESTQQTDKSLSSQSKPGTRKKSPPAVSASVSQHKAKAKDGTFDPTGSADEAGGIRSELENIAKNPGDYWSYERLGWCYWRSACYGKRYSDYYYALYYWNLLKRQFGSVPERGTRDCVDKADEDYRALKIKLGEDAKLGNVLAARIINGAEQQFERAPQAAKSTRKSSKP